MIQVFPSFYPDELVYSLLSRYHVMSGSPAYLYTAEEIFEWKHTSVEIEFINKLSPSGMQLITRNKPMEEVALEHTMFPYYARFVSSERKKRAFHCLVGGEANMNQVLNLEYRKRPSDRFLNYCPICASEDRKAYGETYWHRNHQIMGISICAKHGCYLKSSPITMMKKTKPQLMAAEQIIHYEEDAEPCSVAIELRLAEYLTEVFQAEMDFENDVVIGEYLSHSLSPKYLSESKVQKKLNLFYEDYKRFYQELSEENQLPLQRIEKIFNGKLQSCYEVCQLSLLEGISVADIVSPAADYKDEVKNHIFETIAKENDIDYELVRRIGEAVLLAYRKENRIQQKCGAKSLAWEKIDRELLPEVKLNCSKLYGDTGERPHRVTVEGIRKMMNLPCKRLDKLPQCKTEILQHSESIEEYWAREVVWAYQKLLDEGIAISWKQIRNLTNMRNANFQSCKPYLRKYTDETTAALLENLI